MNRIKSLLAWLLMLASVCVVALSALVLWFVIRATPDAQRNTPVPPTVVAPLPVAPVRQEQRQPVTLRIHFASQKNPNELVAEVHEVLCRSDLLSRLQSALAQLAAGPQRSSLAQALPAGTRILGSFVDPERATAYVDLSREFITAMPTGITQTGRAVYALVNTVAGVDHDGLKEVQLLVEGDVIDQAVGGIEISWPLKPEWSWVSDG
jgi:spore germination protein GerM